MSLLTTTGRWATSWPAERRTPTAWQCAESCGNTKKQGERYRNLARHHKGGEDVGVRQDDILEDTDVDLRRGSSARHDVPDLGRNLSRDTVRVDPVPSGLQLLVRHHQAHQDRGPKLALRGQAAANHIHPHLPVHLSISESLDMQRLQH